MWGKLPATNCKPIKSSPDSSETAFEDFCNELWVRNRTRQQLLSQDNAALTTVINSKYIWMKSKETFALFDHTHNYSKLVLTQ